MPILPNRIPVNEDGPTKGVNLDTYIKTVDIIKNYLYSTERLRGYTKYRG